MPTRRRGHALPWPIRPRVLSSGVASVSHAEFAIRVTVALLFGSLIGLERQWRQRMAGLRTLQIAKRIIRALQPAGAPSRSDSSMNAIVTTPDRPGGLIRTETPVPAANPGHALIRVRATSINRGETRLIGARPNSWAPGQDVAGTVETAAPDGGPPAGTRVVGLADGGAWSELVLVCVDRVAVLPENVDFERAACLPVAGLTALRALRALGDVVGRELLVTGASGGVGNLAVQLARDAGALVTALARRPLKIEGIRVATSLDDVMRFDRVIDGVGGDVLRDALGHLRPHAKVVFYGGGERAPLGLDVLRGSPATIEALFVYQAPGRFDEDLATLVRFVSSGRLQPLVDRTVSIDRVDDALAALQAGGIAGKIVLTR